MPSGNVHARDSVVLAVVVTPVAAVAIGIPEALIIGGGCLLGVLITPDLDLLETQSPLWQEVLSAVVWFATVVLAAVLLWEMIWR